MEAFQEFRNTDADIENNSRWRDFAELFHARTAKKLHTKKQNRSSLNVQQLYICCENLFARLVKFLKKYHFVKKKSQYVDKLSVNMTFFVHA